MNTLTSTLVAIAAAAVTSFTVVELGIGWTPSAPPADNPDVTELRGEIESLRGQLRDVRAEVQSRLAKSDGERTVIPQVSDEQVAAALDRFLAARRSEASGAAKVAMDAAALDDERVKELLGSMVKEEVTRQQSLDMEAPPLSQVAATLELEAWQREQVQREVLNGQKETLALLSTPTKDGTLMIDEIMTTYINAQALPPEQAQASLMKFYGRLMTEVVPGTGETYAQRMAAVNSRVSDGLRRSFSQDQWTEYEKMGITDPTQIQVEGSPWEKAFQEYSRRQQQKEK